MTIITQDGRKLEISHEHDILISGYAKNREHKATVTVTTFTKPIPHEGFKFIHDRELVMRYGVIGEYATNTGRNHAADMLRQAWENGAEDFVMVMPPDIFEKSIHEAEEDFCEEHGLIMVGLDELGYTEREKRHGAHLAQTSDYWERRNIIVSDGQGDYSASLAKWKALHADYPQIA